MDVVYSFATSRLLAQMIGFADERSPDPDRDGSFLLHVLLRPEILQCFLLLYARKIDELPFELDCSDLSALSTQLDRHADVFQHLLLLLDRQPAFVAQFSRLVPSPAALFRDFHLSVARGFALLRAVCDSEALLSSASSPLPPCCDVWSEPFAAALQRLYPASLWASLEFRGFVCFWMLRYADVEQPAQCYAGYRAQVDARIERREKERGAARGDRALARQLARLRQQREALLSDEKAGQTHIETLEVGFFRGRIHRRRRFRRSREPSSEAPTRFLSSFSTASCRAFWLRRWTRCSLLGSSGNWCFGARPTSTSSPSCGARFTF